MQSIRKARLEAAIQEELSQVVAREIKDPRVPPVTFTSVTITPDGSQATVLVTILGGARGGVDGAPPLSEKGAENRMKDCLDGLTSASGYLRRHMARVIRVRHIPTLVFKEDKGFENVLRVQALLREISSDNADKK